LESYSETDLLKALRQESEHLKSIGRKSKEGASTGGNRKRGKTKAPLEQVTQYVNNLRAKHPQHSDEQIYKPAGKEFHISSRTVRTYMKGLKKL